jgi:chromosome partitioning protein
MKVITLLNQKGGTGKTTIASHIATGLALRGQRVLAIDTDAQGNMTSVLGLPLGDGVYRFVVKQPAWTDVLQQVNSNVYTPEGHTGGGLLAVLPSNNETKNTHETLVMKPLYFRQRLGELEGVFDYVVIDTPPTPSPIHTAVLFASTHILFPVELDKLSTEHGLVDSATSVAQIDAAMSHYGFIPPQACGIIPNKARTKTKLHGYVLDALRDQYGEMVWDAIPLSIACQECFMEGSFLWNYADANDARAHMSALVERVANLG